MRRKFKSLFIFLFLIIWNIYSLLAGEIIDTKFSEITKTNNIEYNGEIVKLSFSGVQPIAGNGTEDCVLDKGYPAFASSWVAAPAVIKEGTMYKMWFHGNDGFAIYRIGYAYSYDGTNWTVYSNTAGGMKGAVIGPENSPAFASNWVAAPAVIKDGSMYKMWLVGKDGSTMRIGYAYSYDGTNWTVYSNTAGGMKGAVIGPENSPAFASNWVADPTVIKEGSMYKMWFSGYDGSTRRIGYAYSYDGTNWTVYSNTAGGMKGAVIGPENSPAFASSWVSSPTVIKEGSMYKMWFRGDDGSAGRIGYAYSYDGTNWTVVSNKSGTEGCVLDKGYPAFASSWVSSPTVIKESLMYKMWFSGWDGSNIRIGYGIITFNQSGYFISRIIDIGFVVNLDKIYFYGNVKSDTYIKFQIRAGRTISELNSSHFTGPGNATDTYYTYNGQDLDNITNVRYIQYKAYLVTDNNYYSPELSKVKFTYTLLYEMDGEGLSIDDIVLVPNLFNPYKYEKCYLTFFNCPDDTKIRIYNIVGKKERELKNPDREHKIIWYATDSSGKPLPSGVYIAVAEDSKGNVKYIKFIIQR